jgi:acetyl esterase/lipase
MFKPDIVQSGGADARAAARINKKGQSYMWRQLMGALLAHLPALAAAQAPAPPPLFGPPPGPPPTHANIAYAPAEPADGKGHLLDLYLPSQPKGPVPIVIWTGGSAWMMDNGKDFAGWIAPQLTKAGFAVAGVSIRSSFQTVFPGQLHDIKAAIRWLRANGAKYGVDGSRIAVMGDSSGGWTAAMAAVTGDVPDLEGTIGTTGVSSAIQAAVAFYPPTRLTKMDAWATKPCTPGLGVMRAGMGGGFCHDDADSPESRLIGCAIQSCKDKTLLADPTRYISANDPPIMILHGESDPLVPHAQGELLYQALNKACHDAVFISLPKAGHGPAPAFLTDDTVRAGATIRSTANAGCAVKMPDLYTPSIDSIIDFLRTAFGSQK